MLNGHEPYSRALTDIDFLVPQFDRIPSTLAGLFLFWHVHPADPPGKTLVQFVDAETALRIDVFRASGLTMNRTHVIEFPTGPIRILEREDVIAHGARLLLAQDINVPVPEKHARDYLRISAGTLPADLEAAWQDHRKPDHPCVFRDADEMVRKLISTRARLLISPQYSTRTRDLCPRCVSNAPFPLADPTQILTVLRYC